MGSEGMPIDELAEKLAVNQGEIIKTLFMKGIMVSVNQVPPPLLPSLLLQAEAQAVFWMSRSYRARRF